MANEQERSRRFHELTPDQQRIVIEAVRSRERTGAGQAPRRRAAGPVPQSYTQRRLWFLYRLDPDSAMYNMPECVRIDGALDRDLCTDAFNDVVHRHSSLRTVFADSDEGPIQRILDYRPHEVELVEVSQTGRAEAEVPSLITQVAQQPFDLCRGPVVRLTLLRVSLDRHYLIVNMHHIVSDGWSVGIFVRDFSEFYRARLERRAPNLPVLPIEFADVVEWQHSRMSARLDELKRFCGTRLGGIESLRLPFDRPPTASVRENGAFQQVRVDSATTALLKSLATQWGATLFMALLAAFKGLLTLHSAQEDIAIGVPVAGRTHPSIENVIGFFANTVLVRTQVNETLSFRQIVDRVRDSSLDAFEHAEAPFDLLLELTRPARMAGRNPLFQVMFILQNTKRPVFSLPAMEMKLMPIASTSVKFDMLFELGEVDGGITGWLGFRTDLFNVATVARFAEAYERLVVAVCGSPDTPLGELQNLPSGSSAAGFNDDLEQDPAPARKV